MAFFDETVLDRINSEAKQVHFSRVILTLIAGLLYGVGWVAARTFAVLWLAAAWLVTAVKVGWQEGRKATPKRI